MKKFKFTALQRAWLNALKSGNYRQYRGALGNSNGKTRAYCCLGVACSVATRLNGELRRRYPRSLKKFGEVAFGEDVMDLPMGIAEKMNMPFDSTLKTPFKIGDKSVYSLIALNDEFEWTFKQIAEYIEKNPENVFGSRA